MDKIISFGKGIRRQPSIGEDGELSELVNLIPKNGELVNVRGMEQIANIKLGEGHTYIGVIHANEQYDVHFAKSERYLYYLFVETNANADFTSENVGKKDCGDAIGECQIIGRCLVCYCPYTRYFLVRGNTLVEFDDYIRDIRVTFGLQGKLYETLDPARSEYTVQDASPDVPDYGTANTLYAKDAGAYITGLVGSRENEGKFVNPFMVRYAYRMYDNTTKCHSSPVFVPCCNKYGAIGLYEYSIEYLDGGNTKFTYNTRCKFYENDLYYMLTKKVDLSDLSDIVLGINIYICPIGMVGGETGSFISSEDLETYFNYSAKNDEFKFEERTIDGEIDGVLKDLMVCWDKKRALRDIKECATFYLLDEISIDELVYGTYKKVRSKSREKLLASAILEDELSDSYLYKANVAYSYNGRIIRGGMEREFKKNLALNKSAACTIEQNFQTSHHEKYNIYVSYDNNGKTEYRGMYADGEIRAGSYIPYLFLPVPTAKELIIEKDGMCATYTMYRHAFLNGAYVCHDELGNLLDGMNGSMSSIELKSGAFESLSNHIQISEVNKPFVYKAINEVSVGSGRILGVSTSAKALSQGQFGQFPLYVFCTDGVWALEIANDGTFRSVQPVSRDVCNNPDSITQIDGAVVFTTDQGLKLIQGSEVVLLSGHMDGHNVKESDYFPPEFFASFGKDEYDDLVVDESRDMRDILKTCKISYDYTNQLLRIFPYKEEIEDTDDKPYRYYVYSFTTREFATVISNEGAVNNVVADYPSSIIQIGKSLYRSMTTEREGLHNGLLLTRPIDMGEPFALKKLQDMKLHYTKHNKANGTFVKMVVYVSNDGENWYVLPSLRKRSFKYYRVALITKMTDNDALSGMIMRYELERTNKIR